MFGKNNKENFIKEFLEMMYGYTKEERIQLKTEHSETYQLDFKREPTRKRLSSSFLKKRMT